MKSFKEIKSLSRDQLKSNWMLPVLFSAITLVLGFLSSLFNGENLLVTILLFMVSIYSSNLYLNIVKFNKRGTVTMPGNKALKSLGFIFFNSILIFTVTFVLIMLSSSISSDSVIIFITSMIIYVTTFIIGLYLSFSIYLILDMNLKIFESVKLSFMYMKGNILKTLKLYLTFIPWILLGFVTAGVGFLYVMPYLQTIYANYYLEIKENFELKIA